MIQCRVLPTAYVVWIFPLATGYKMPARTLCDALPMYPKLVGSGSGGAVMS